MSETHLAKISKKISNWRQQTYNTEKTRCWSFFLHVHTLRVYPPKITVKSPKKTGSKTKRPPQLRGPLWKISKLFHGTAAGTLRTDPISLKDVQPRFGFSPFVRRAVLGFPDLEDEFLEKKWIEPLSPPDRRCTKSSDNVAGNFRWDTKLDFFFWSIAETHVRRRKPLGTIACIKIFLPKKSQHDRTTSSRVTNFHV